MGGYYIVTRYRKRWFPTLDAACSFGASLDMNRIPYILTDSFGNALE